MPTDTENANVFVVFLSKGYGGAGAAPEFLLTNDALLRDLQKACEGIDFTVRDLTASDASVEEVYSELYASRESLDGVLLVGDLLGEYRLAFTGLPTVHVYNLFEFLHTPYKLFQTGEEEDSIYEGGIRYENGRILTAELDRRNVCSPAASKAMFDDLVAKLKLIGAINKLKQSRILQISPKRYFSIDDYHGHDGHKKWPEEYNERYARALKESLGIEIVSGQPEEFYEAYQEADEAEATLIAGEWAEAAEEVTAAESEIVKAARAYLAFEAVRERYDCNAISTILRSLTGSGKTEDMFWPGLGAECGFKLRGIQATCQDHMNIVVTELLGYFLTGRPSMLGDLMIDRQNSVDILTHCGAPINPYGDERRVPYRIRTHAQSPVRDTQEPGSGTGLQVEWPVGETVTIWKVYVLNHKIGLHTGEIVDGRSLYENLDDIMCRTKLIAKVDDIDAVQRHQSPDEYGIHRAGTLGDVTERIEQVARLTGLGIMKEHEND